jgi:transcriptional regulator GlxA family with amidase domain
MTSSLAANPSALRPLLRRDCELGGVARLRVWEHDGSARIAARPAAHPGIELAWIDTGHVHYAVGSTEISAGPGAVVVVPTWAEHTTTFDTAVRGIALQLDPELVAEISDAAAPRSARLSAGQADPGTIPTLVTLLEREIARAAAGWRIAADALIEAIVVEMLRAAPGASDGRAARDARIAAAVDAIETRYAEPLSVDDLARAAGMSRFHFSRLFREQIGEAPYQHLLRIRIARAAELLRHHRRSVTEAALEVGFQDLGRFSRVFRAQIGCLPSALGRRTISARS